MYRYKSIDISIFIDMNQSSGYLVYFWVSRYQLMLTEFTVMLSNLTSFDTI
jgi:hypothetical protein